MKKEIIILGGIIGFFGWVWFVSLVGWKVGVSLVLCLWGNNLSNYGKKDL